MKRGTAAVLVLLVATSLLAGYFIGRAYAAASYPSAVKVFTTRSTGDVIAASHINDLQDEIAAVESGLLNGLAHNLPPSATGLRDLGTSSLGWRTLFIDVGTLTDVRLGIDAKATWNDAADTFNLINAAITDTNSAAASTIVTLKVGAGATPKFSIRKDGLAHMALNSASAAVIAELGRDNAGTFQSLVEARNAKTLVTSGNEVGRGAIRFIDVVSTRTMEVGFYEFGGGIFTDNPFEFFTEGVSIVDFDADSTPFLAVRNQTDAKDLRLKHDGTRGIIETTGTAPGPIRVAPEGTGAGSAVAVHRSFTLADAANAVWTTQMDGQTRFFAFVSASEEGCLFYIHGGDNAVTEVSDPETECSATKDGAGTTNVYWDGVDLRYEIQNNQGASRTYSVVIIGAQ